MYLCSMYTYLVQKCSLKMPGSFITFPRCWQKSKNIYFFVECDLLHYKTKKTFLTEEQRKVLSYLRNLMSAQCLPLSSHRLFQGDPKHGNLRQKVEWNATLDYLINKNPRLLFSQIWCLLQALFHLINTKFTPPLCTFLCNKQKISPTLLVYSALLVY